jgi:hypothetical protein
MRRPQVLVYENDRRLAGELAGLKERRKWVLHEPRRTTSCLGLLAAGGPAVLVLEIGGSLRVKEDDKHAPRRRERELFRRFRLLERAAWLFPQTRVLVVGDAAHAGLAGLAWDLGAALCLFPPGPEDRLAEIVAALMGLPDEPETEDDADDA